MDIIVKVTTNGTLNIVVNAGNCMLIITHLEDKVDVWTACNVMNWPLGEGHSKFYFVILLGFSLCKKANELVREKMLPKKITERGSILNIVKVVI